MGGGGNRTTLATFIREKRHEDQGQAKQPGPFLTISRQYGCHGYFLGLLLVDLLNTEPQERHPWHAYSRDILSRLSNETDMAAETLNRLRREQPRALTEFFRSLTARRMPGAYEVRDRIATMVRTLAYEGHAIIIGMGSAGATSDIPNGLRVRLEAPLEWRVARIVECEGIKPAQARIETQQQDRDRQRLREIYVMRYHREPAFDLVYDCSNFSLAQIAQHVVAAMRLKRMF